LVSAKTGNGVDTLLEAIVERLPSPSEFDSTNLVAMLITPGATAYLLTDKFYIMTVISVLSAIISSLIGIYVSFWFDLETGGSIVLAQTFIFLFAFLFAPRYGIFKLKKLFAGYK